MSTSADALQDFHAGGGDDLLIARIDLVRDRVSYLTYFGGSGDDDPRAVAVAADGTASIVGHTTSADFPIFDAFQDTYTGTTDVFIMTITGLNRSGEQDRD